MSFPFELDDDADLGLNNLSNNTIPKEYAIDFNTGQITGEIVTGIDAIKVWIWLSLHTSRYRYAIFSWDYGQEIDSLIGKSYSEEYINNVVPDMIRECLLVNQNITDIKDMNIVITNDKLACSFTAITNLGEVDISV